MPAYPTHSLFSHLALLALIDERHPLAEIAARHDALFRIAGIAGCDIQCMPYQICSHCHAPYRHNRKEDRACLVCRRQALQDFYFAVSDGRRLTRVDIERDLYANTHLVLYRTHRGYGVAPATAAGPPEQPFPGQVIRHLANCLRDAGKIAGRKNSGNYLAFTLGWFSHVVSDAIFKGVYPHAAKVNFFGDQYSLKMLPAAETLTMTDISYDFGVTWPVWHQQLLAAEPDGGALKHITMGDAAERYDARDWTAEFGKPDPAIGRVIDAVQPLNRKWFQRMYVQPDYTAPSPLLDALPLSMRASSRFGETQMDLGQLRRFALTTGWYEAFIKGVGIYLRAVNEACRLAGIAQTTSNVTGSTAAATQHRRLISPPSPGVPSWNLWRNIVSDAIRPGVPREENWGSELQIDPDAVVWLRKRQGQSVRFLLGHAPTDYQQALVKVLRNKFQLRSIRNAPRAIVIGPPAFNPAAPDLLCVEDSLRHKYDQGLAGLVRLSPDRARLLVVGLSDFGDDRLAHWVDSIPA